MMNAEILSIGTELLLGDIVNTNAQYLAQELSVMGVNVYRIVTVGDNPVRLARAFEESLERADLIIATGGLGPTKDDLSKEVAMEVFGQIGTYHEPTLERLTMQFNGDAERVKLNEKQAIFPADALVLPNRRGTAPGCMLTKGEKRIVLLPGPPHEMKEVFSGFVDWWNEHFAETTIRSKVLRLAGIGESDAAFRLGDLLDRENPSLAPYAKPFEVTLRLTGRGHDPEEIHEQIAALEKEVRERLADYVYGEDSDSLESVIVNLLKVKDLTVATAESITGGLVASTLINTPGASDVLGASYIVYSDAAKHSELGVSEKTLIDHSAVSSEVCEEMLRGTQERTNADVCIATTGYAGPAGDDVGLVYIGVLVNEEMRIEKMNFHGDRQMIRNRTARNALAMLWSMLR